MSVDISKIKPGDEVTVRAIVTESPRGNDQWPVRGVIDGFSTTAGEYAVEAYFAPRAIVSHIPKALGVGDRVKRRSSEAAVIGELLAVHRDDAWVLFHASAITLPLSELERVDA